MSPRAKRLLALGILLVGGGLIANTVVQGRKEDVDLHVTLTPQIKDLRLDVAQDGHAVHHLEWSYGTTPPASQDAHLALPPGEYLIRVHAGGAARDPTPTALSVHPGERAKATFELQ